MIIRTLAHTDDRYSNLIAAQTSIYTLSCITLSFWHPLNRSAIAFQGICFFFFHGKWFTIDTSIEVTTNNTYFCSFGVFFCSEKYRRESRDVETKQKYWGFILEPLLFEK